MTREPLMDIREIYAITPHETLGRLKALDG
jgi:hypothetical protein